MENGDFPNISFRVPCEGAPPKRRGTLTHRKWGKFDFFLILYFKNFIVILSTEGQV